MTRDCGAPKDDSRKKTALVAVFTAIMGLITMILVALGGQPETPTAPVMGKYLASPGDPSYPIAAKPVVPRGKSDPIAVAGELAVLPSHSSGVEITGKLPGPLKPDQD